jgi:hypothetical protein
MILILIENDSHYHQGKQYKRTNTPLAGPYTPPAGSNTFLAGSNTVLAGPYHPLPLFAA